MLMVHFMIITTVIGIADSIGILFWYIDRVFLFFGVFILQWLLLGKNPPLGRWLGSGVLALITWIVLLWSVGPLISHLIRETFFPHIPNSRTDGRYIFMQQFIVNTLLGGAIGINQWLLLKKVNLFSRWWIVMTTLAYAMTTLWWYYYRILN